MEKATHSPKFLRKRKLLLVLPLLVLPFLTLMFWALGGGTTESRSGQEQAQKGLNMKLPDAYLKDDPSLDKMSYYNKAESDSAKRKQLLENDPYYQADTTVPPMNSPSGLDRNYKYKGKNPLNTSAYGNSDYIDPHEAKVYQKLEQLNTALDKSAIESGTKDYEQKSYSTSSDNPVNSQDVDRLETMMNLMNEPGEEDAEMKQLNGMLEKILDIQHPERIREKIKKTSEEKKGQVFVVTSAFNNNPISLLNNSESKNSLSNHDKMLTVSNGFYSIGEANPLSNVSNVIEAVVHENQTLVTGSVIKLRLTNDVFINGTLIPKDNFLFGIASLNGERLEVVITDIRYQSALFPVELSVYDMDGLRGIYIPGAITRDVAKQSADDAIQSLGMNSLNTSIGAQAASAGIETAKNLFTKKIKLIKVSVKAGYRVFLRDEKQQ